MRKFDKHFERLMIHEGGYVNDPVDRGGETNFGITKRRYPHLDIKNLTREDARQIYFDDFWMKYGVPKFPVSMQYIVFDMIVNHGSRNAFKIIQKAINHKAGNPDLLKVDGKFGPQSKLQFSRYTPENDRVLAFRAKFYCDICRANPSQYRFFKGWMTRCFDLARN